MDEKIPGSMVAIITNTIPVRMEITPEIINNIPAAFDQDVVFV
jgi:hypothetical protein